MGVGVGGVVNYTNTSSGTASDVVAYGGVGGPYEYVSFFSVLNWFSKGEPGAWYDPSDISINWRRNLLTYSQDFSNAAWIKSNVTGTNILTTSAGGAYVRELLPSYSSIISFTLLCRVAKTIGSTRFPMFSIALQGGTSTFGEVILDTNTGLAQPRAGLADNFPTNITSVDKGSYWELSYSLESRSGNITASLWIYPTISSDGSTINTTLTGSVKIDAVQLEQSSSASVYQKITDGVQDYYTVQPQPVLFQDSAGTIPITYIEQPVGLMLDKSKGLALGAELVTNGGPFIATTGWVSRANCTLAVVGAELIGTGTVSGSVYRFYYQPVTVIGYTYKVTVNITSLAGTGDMLTVYSSAGAGQITSISIPTTGIYTVYFTATTTTTCFEFGDINSTSPKYTGISNISIKQIAGNHAFQATSGNKPLLSARVNLLTKTEDFSDAVWVKATLNGTLSSGNISPTGSTNAILYQEDTTASVQRGLYEVTTVVSGISHTLTIYAKDYALGSKRYLTLYPQNVTQSYAVFDLSNATNTFTGGANYLSSSISSIGNGWCKCSITFTTASTTLNSVLYLSNLPLDQAPAYKGDGVSGIYIWGADLRPTNAGALLPAYQRVTTASDYDTVGFPLYLACNGTVSSRSMSTNSIDFTSTDKMTVVTGVRKLSDAAQGMIAELNVDTSGNGSFYCIASPGNFAGWGGLSKGTVARAPQVVTGYIAPISDVYTLLNDISAPFSKLRLNSNQVDSNTNSQGSGNFGNYPLYLFARAGTSLFLNGQFYGAIIRGAQSDTASVVQTENYMAQKTGITF